MNRFVWATDTHFDHADPAAYKAFVTEVQSKDPKGLLLSGDVADAPSVADILRSLAKDLSCPIYFVLGNHDYYGSSVKAVREQMKELCSEEPLLHYLADSGPIPLDQGFSLLGQDGWADGRSGDYEGSHIVLNDRHHIADLMGKDKSERLKVQQRLADESAARLAVDIDKALEISSKIAVVTHIPPYREACLYDDHISDAHWAPHFVCKAIGDMLIKVAGEHTQAEFRVFCGHSHHSAEYSPVKNITVHCGFAEYGRPWPQDIGL